MVRAASSFPVPLSPMISTEATEGATCWISDNTRCMIYERPPRFTTTPRSRSRRRATSSCRSLSWRSRQLRSSTCRRCGLSGFSRKLKAPSLVASTASSMLAWPVSMMKLMPGRVSRTCLSRSMPPNHRHAQIGDHQHRVERGNFFQGLLAVRGALCLVAPGANQLGQRVTQAHVVLDYEHPGIGRHVHISPPRRNILHDFGPTLNREGQTGDQ